ncbi:MAG: glycosyltransferase [Candidatus Melainabacteria bacterium]|nr:glycosyltransferase [Candidatus Melainabacteria bacterium]
MKPHLVFFHQNYPAQFGPIIQFLLKHYEVDITYFSEHRPKPVFPGMEHRFYRSHNVPKFENPYFFTRYIELESRAMYGAYLAYEKQKPRDADVLIGHVGFGNLMFFHGAYPEIPTIGFFEIFYDLLGGDRPGFEPALENKLRRPIRNATQLLELEYCTKGYSPTRYQRSTFPQAYQHKLHTLFDGVDVSRYSPGEVGHQSELPCTWPKDAKIVTYVARGLESYRGFDIFMEMAHRICQVRNDVHFVIAGRPKTHYGPDLRYIQEPSFKEHVLKQHPFDLSRFHFLDWISESALADLFRLSACHFYWTVPFTLSWSFFQAMASGALIVGSDTEPVRDVLIHGMNGLMVPPYDVDTMVQTVLSALDHPQHYQPLREAARDTVVNQYSFEVCLPKLADFYLSALSPASRPSLQQSTLAAAPSI